MPGPPVHFEFSADKSPIQGIGWFAHCKDTEGNGFSLFEGDDSAGA